MTVLSFCSLMKATGVDPKTGLLKKEEHAATHFIPVFLPKGTQVRWKDDTGKVSLFSYSAEPDARVLYTYYYPKEGNWCLYQASDGQEVLPKVWRCEKDMYARFVFQGAIRYQTLDETGVFRFPPKALPQWLDQEASNVAGRVKKTVKEDSFVAVLLGDSHCAAGSNWADTACSIRRTMDGIPADRLIHLGDLTDGSMPRGITEKIAQCMLTDMNGLGIPVRMCIGNHDYNAFRGNAPAFTPREAAAFYLDRETGWYLEDIPEKNLRLFYLDSFEPARKQRYGFSSAELHWFRKNLRRTPDGRDVIVFSHVPPAAQIHVWSKRILNGKRMLRLLDRANRKKRIRVRGWFHGHSHVDQIWVKHSFPVICTGCSKTEMFFDHKPVASDTPIRRWNERRQELWDVLLVGHDEIRMIRFGAGEDRVIPAEG